MNKYDGRSLMNKYDGRSHCSIDCVTNYGRFKKKKSMP